MRPPHCGPQCTRFVHACKDKEPALRHDVTIANGIGDAIGAVLSLRSGCLHHLRSIHEAKAVSAACLQDKGPSSNILQG